MRYVETHSCELFSSHVEIGGEGLVFLHCKVHKNTPSCLKAVKKELKFLIEFYKEHGVHNIYAYTRNDKYARLMGGRLINTFVDGGVEYEVYLYGD